MVTMECVAKGVAKYLDAEIMSQYQDGSIQKMLIGTGLALMIRRTEKFAEMLKANPIVQALDVIDADGNVDIDVLKDAVKANIPDTGVIYENKMIGKMTFMKADVDKLYSCITTV